jgi:hypothetical protein
MTGSRLRIRRQRRALGRLALVLLILAPIVIVWPSDIGFDITFWVALPCAAIIWSTTLAMTIIEYRWQRRNGEGRWSALWAAGRCLLMISP